MQCRDTDRPPLTFWRHFAGEDAQGERCARLHGEFFHATGMDMVKVMHDGLSAPCSLEARTAADLLAYRPLGRRNPYIEAYVDRCKRVVDEIGTDVYVYCNVFAPFTLLRRIGDERLAGLIRSARPAILHAMDVLAEEIALLSELVVRESGCLGTFVAFQGAEETRFSDEDFDELVRPYDLRVLSAANAVSAYNILHFCAWDEIRNRMERWRQYPGRAVNWAIYVDGMTLPQGRAYFGGRPVLGGFDNRRGRVLYSGSREQVMARTREIVADYVQATGSTRGLIVGADCSLLTDFERERFTWVRDALMEL